jgi:hypothetical protein
MRNFVCHPKGGRLTVFKEMVLRRIFGSKTAEVTEAIETG